MIPGLRFGLTSQIVVKLRLSGKSDAVNSLHHRLGFIASEICSGNLSQMKAISRDIARICHVSTHTQVGEVAISVERHLTAGRLFFALDARLGSTVMLKILN